MWRVSKISIFPSANMITKVYGRSLKMAKFLLSLPIKLSGELMVEKESIMML